MIQLTFDQAAPNGPIRNKLERAYRQWLAENPGIFEMFEDAGKEAARPGRKFSVYLLVERIRWHKHMNSDKDVDGFKINNNFRPYIARDLIERHPEWANLIETRSIREDEVAEGW